MQWGNREFEVDGVFGRAGFDAVGFEDAVLGASQGTVGVEEDGRVEEGGGSIR